MSILRDKIIKKAISTGVIKNENELTEEDKRMLLMIDSVQNKKIEVDDILNYCEKRRERAIKELTINYTTHTEEERVWYSCLATITGEIASNIRAVSIEKQKQEKQINKMYNLDND